MTCSATLLAAAMSILYLASTMRIHTDKSRSIVDESDTKHDEDFTYHPAAMSSPHSSAVGLAFAGPGPHLHVAPANLNENVAPANLNEKVASIYLDALTAPANLNAKAAANGEGQGGVEGTTMPQLQAYMGRPQYVVKQMAAEEMHRMQRGAHQQRPHAEASFLQVGAGYCLNAEGSTVDGYSLMANSKSECKNKCADSEHCLAIQWHILPLLSCTLFNQTFTETSETQVKDLHAWRGPECWNKQASGNSTKTDASVSVLQRLTQQLWQ